MTRRVVVAYPEVENLADWKHVLAVRDRYDPLASNIAAHLTLVFPFEDPMSDRDLEKHLQDAVSKVPDFEITLAGITAHENEYLFLNVKRGNDAVIHLHDVLYDGALAPHLVRGHTFVPHVTVGRLSTHALAAALDATAGLGRPIDAHIKSISVYRIEQSGDRTDVFELPLAPRA
jgi:2'-5' RNA ligase